MDVCHRHLFWKRQYPPSSSGVRCLPWIEASPHIPEHSACTESTSENPLPFQQNGVITEYWYSWTLLIQTEQFRVVIYTFSLLEIHTQNLYSSFVLLCKRWQIHPSGISKCTDFCSSSFINSCSFLYTTDVQRHFRWQMLILNSLLSIMEIWCIVASNKETFDRRHALPTPPTFWG